MDRNFIDSSIDGKFNQDCHYGMLSNTDQKYVDGIQTLNGQIVYCYNPQCPDKICRYSFFSGGMIEDSQCTFYVKSYRNRI